MTVMRCSGCEWRTIVEVVSWTTFSKFVLRVEGIFFTPEFDDFFLGFGETDGAVDGLQFALGHDSSRRV